MKLTKNVSITIVIVALAGIVAALLLTASAQTGVWTTKAPMPTPRSHLAIGEVNGRLYAVGGYKSRTCCPDPFIATVEAYDPATDTWTSKASMPTARGDFGVGVVNGILYAVGGQNSSGALATVEAYNPLIDTWTTRTSMPTARYAPGVAVINGILYAVGGHSTGELATLEAYDPATDTWTAKASMPTPRGRLGVGTVNGILYAVGGGDSLSCLATVEAYDPATNTWTSKAPLPVPNGPAVAAVNGVLYAVGGAHNCISSGVTNEVDAYNPNVNAWTMAPSMPTARAGLGVGVVNGVLYAMGGTTDDLAAFAVVEAFTPTAVCTSPPPNMVSWWPGDGNANDIEDGNNGVLQGGATFAPGMVAQGFSFDGVDDYVNVAANPNLHPSAITVDAWLQARDLSNPPGTTASSIVTSNLGDFDGYQLQIEEDGTVGFVLGGGPVRTYYRSAPAAVVVGQWYHVAVTYDGLGGPGSLKLYVDGVQRTFSLHSCFACTEPSGPIFYSGNYPLTIGQRNQPAVGNFNGLIDEVEVFNRPLNLSEIQAIFNSGSAGKCKPTPTPTPTPHVGPPTNKDQCKDGGWHSFDTPRHFKNQGDCIQFINAGK
jgi:N-acetylneuraminic acid mutarotase